MVLVIAASLFFGRPRSRAIPKKAGVYMNVIWKYIFTNVKERKMRTAVMLLSILLSTTLLFVSFSIGASYENAQQKMARGRCV